MSYNKTAKKRGLEKFLDNLWLIVKDIRGSKAEFKIHGHKQWLPTSDVTLLSSRPYQS